MTAIPEWPEADGARVLTLVGNDLTIDTRARKTASSLARAGFSVISIGIDNVGVVERTTDLDGARLVRVVPPSDGRVSPRPVRLSRPELREAFRHRTELERQRLQLGRRTHLAYVDRPPGRLRFTHLVGGLWAGFSRRLGVPEATRARVRRGLDRRGGRIERSLTGRASRWWVITRQLRFQAASGPYRFLARPRSRFRRRGRWRRDLPELHRYEAAVGGFVDALEPDLVHVHDVFHLGVAVRAKRRAAARGRVMRVVYDAHEHVPGLPIEPRKRAGYVDLEREYVPEVDAVVTVSPGLIRLVAERFGMEAALVLNAPDPGTFEETTPLRSVVDLTDDVDLAVYVGGLAAHRGAEDLVEALSLLPPTTHLVFVTNAVGGYVDTLRAHAAALGVGDRLHLAPYVAPEAVVAYIASADVSVIPLSREVANYEVALPNKLFQSIHAGVPVAVSDNPDMAAFVTEHGIGEVFAGGDPASMAAAIASVLADRASYRSRASAPTLVDETAWPTQVERLVATYERLGVHRT